MEGIVTKKGRMGWIRKNPDLMKSLIPSCKLIMMYFYHLREINKISKKNKAFGLTHSVLSRYVNLLKDLGLLKSKRTGRESIFMITPRGDQFVTELFYYIKTGKECLRLDVLEDKTKSGGTEQ